MNLNDMINNAKSSLKDIAGLVNDTHEAYLNGEVDGITLENVKRIREHQQQFLIMLKRLRRATDNS